MDAAHIAHNSERRLGAMWARDKIGDPGSRRLTALNCTNTGGAGGARTHDPGIMRYLRAPFRPA
jgi:hypothetical protein